MSGTPVPSLSIRELNTGLGNTPDVGEGVTLKVGVASAGPFLKPYAASTLATINSFGVGPLVSSAGPHQEASGLKQYLFRVVGSIAGTFGTVTKSPVTNPASPSSLTLSAAIFSARADGNPLPGGAVLNVTTGFTDPPSPLPLKIVIGAGGVAHTVTLAYYDSEGVQKSATIAISGVGTFTTAAGADVKSIISYVTSIDPVGTSTLSWDYAGPLDRFDHLKWQVSRGGQINVTGAQTPLVRYSFDNGITYSPAFQVPSTGVLDIYTYPGGATRWHTGIRATWTQGTVSSSLYGSVRSTGATVNGDLDWTMGTATATIAIVDGGVSPVFTVVGNAVTLTTPVATTTANAVVTFFNTDTSAGTLQARQILHSVQAIGTGAGFLAAFAATGAANGGIAWTAKVPGVRIRQVVAGVSVTETITVAGLDVTIVSATDANGAPTSTPNSVLATLALAVHADAQALLSGVASGTGAGLIGSWSTYIALRMAMEQGDEWTSYTTPPLASASDLQAGLNTLKSNFKKVLSNIEHVHVVQDNADNVPYQNFVTWLTAVKRDLKIPLWGTMQGLYNLPASYSSEALWSNAFISALPSPRSSLGYVDLEGGEVDTLVTLYGCQLAMNVATLDVARVMNCIISKSPNQTRCSTKAGTQFALPGSGLHTVAGTEEKQALWEGDESLNELHAQNVTTCRTIPEYDGVFIRQTLCYVDDGNSFIFHERRRVMNRAYRRVTRSLIVFLNASLLTNLTTGALAEIEAQQIEGAVTADLNSGGLLNDQNVNHVSAFKFQVSRVEQTAKTLTVVWALQIVPLAKVLTLSGDIGFALTITDTFSVATT